MSGLKWTINRLWKMSPGEVLWRIGQYIRSKSEERLHMGKPLTTKVYYRLREKAFLPWPIVTVPRYMNIGDPDKIFGTFNVRGMDAHDAFYESRRWPLEPSHLIKYKQRPDMGDARINWEMNRHYGYVILAKNYRLTGDEIYLKQLMERLESWVKVNPFLMGISYVSEMELAIRALSWYFTYEFLPMEEETRRLREMLGNGILNMLGHVEKHHSRYSSANNHLIVEMAALGIVGVSFGIKRWIQKSLAVMPDAVMEQNTVDGVNKEQSIHYHAFVMEAVALWSLRLKKANYVIDENIDKTLDKMACFLADMMDCRNGVPHLGDDDEGKLFDLYGRRFNYYQYVLQLCGAILTKRYIPLDHMGYCEQLYALFDLAIPNGVKTVRERSSIVYPVGGHSIMRHNRKDGHREVLLTMDHAPLGYGSIAAHGHADALHMTMRIDGWPIFVDPGTYIYHGEIEWRNYFRQTGHHNTIELDEEDQSEMQGAFLWGKRAKTTLGDYVLTSSRDMVTASHDGYNPYIHERCLVFDHPDMVRIQDSLIRQNEAGTECRYVLTFVVDSECKVQQIGINTVVIERGKTKVKVEVDSGIIALEPMYMSKHFGQKEATTSLKIHGSFMDECILNTILTITR